ncbi:MAG: hypothetical protein WCK02_16065 [Bacteroidota bacterium]
MSEIVVIEKYELQSLIQNTARMAIDSYIRELMLKTDEKLVSINETMKLMGLGHKKVKQLLIDDKLKCHDSGKIIHSSIVAYLKVD